MTQSREVLAMMDNHTTTFGRKRGCNLSPCGAFFLAICFVFGIVLTGLLTYHFAPCLDEKLSRGDTGRKGGRALSFEPKKQKIDIRLPQSVRPHLYEIKLMPFIWEGNFTFNGEVRGFLIFSHFLIFHFIIYRIGISSGNDSYFESILEHVSA